MNLKRVLARWISTIACAALVGNLALAAPSGGGARGRWLDVGPRATVLEGLLCDEQGENSHRIEALLVPTSLASGVLYGSLEPIAAEPMGSVRMAKLLLIGEYARAGDGSGTFAAVVVLDLFNVSGVHRYQVAGSIRGALDPCVSDGSGFEVIDPVAHDAALSMATAPEQRSFATRLLRARAAVRKMLNISQALPFDPIDEIVDLAMNVESKGAFRARWFLR